MNASSTGSPRYLFFRCNLSEISQTREGDGSVAEILESDDFLRRLAYSVSGGPYGVVLDQRPFVHVSVCGAKPFEVALCDGQWAMLRKCSINLLPGSKRRGKK